MSLENTNKSFFGSDQILRIFLALVFLSAGVFRLFNPDVARMEFRNLYLPEQFSYFVIILELAAGALLALNKFTVWVYRLLIIFLISALVLAIVISGKSLLLASHELFVFNLTPTDFFLHLVFLIIASYLVLNKRRDHK